MYVAANGNTETAKGLTENGANIESPHVGSVLDQDI